MAWKDFAKGALEGARQSADEDSYEHRVQDGHVVVDHEHCGHRADEGGDRADGEVDAACDDDEEHPYR
jgi:hypothetical protein